MPRCPSCSVDSPSGSRFCASCGADLGEVTSAATRTSVGSSPSRTSLDEARFTAGTLLAGRYRIIGLLGRGGMGEVYRAEDLKLGQQVALKFLPADMEKDGHRLSRLLNEVRLARQVSHPNVCRVYDVDEIDGSHFMAMEYVDGEDLASLLRRIGRLPNEKALEIARQICAGLAAAHEQGILHRDLKPANVMLDGRGRVKLADFGLANLDNGIKGNEARAGTPAYMAPEQLAGREVTVRSDVYSLGLVLYEIFTGKQAYPGKTAAEMMKLQDQSIPPNPTSLVTHVDEIVEQVILRCLEKEPGARPATALAVSAALPGGDPLAAALAAGETPSPEMVAKGGGAGGLRPMIGVGALVAVILAIVLSGATKQRDRLYPKLPLDTPPAELSAKAVEFLKRIGVAEPGPHRRFGFVANNEYLTWIEDNDDAATRWVSLGTGSPPGGLFWFRYSAKDMIPDDIHGFDVGENDPAQKSPGQGRVRLDLQGRLQRIEIVPDPMIPADRDTIAWGVLFEAAGLDLEKFERTDPIRAPLTPGDELRAWRGPVYGTLEGVVQIGRLAGTPTSFEVIGPWGLDEATEPPQNTAPFIIGLFLVAILISTLFLAQRNLKAGRSDQRGANKVMAFFVICVVGAWFFTEIHLQTLAAGVLFGELAFGRLLGHGLVHAILAGLFYVALEPYVRRLWPETLVSWSRLLMGRFRDPLVGRDLLLGMAIIGLLANLLGYLMSVITGSLEIPLSLKFEFLGTNFSGVRYAFASLLTNAEGAVSVAMLLLVMLLLLRLLLRRNWAAIAAAMVIISIAFTSGPKNEGLPVWLTIVGMIGFLILAAVLAVLMLRLGLLAVIGGMFMLQTLGNAPLTWNFSIWYAGSGLVMAIAVLALAGWAFYISLAGQSLFKDSVLD